MADAATSDEGCAQAKLRRVLPESISARNVETVQAFTGGAVEEGS